jgi:hypothetical protein
MAEEKKSFNWRNTGGPQGHKEKSKFGASPPKQHKG